MAASLSGAGQENANDSEVRGNDNAFWIQENGIEGRCWEASADFSGQHRSPAVSTRRTACNGGL